MEFNINSVTKNKIIEMLQEEQKIRYSKGVQEAYTTQYYAMTNNNYNTVNIEREIQRFILKKFGFTDNFKSLKQYWKIPYTYWNDEEVKNSIFYMKLNIFQYTKLNINDNMIDIQVINYKTSENILLSQLELLNKPLIILAGSMTWPPFRASIHAYQEFYNKYFSVATIYILYILEAHFVEKDADGNFIGGWPIGYQYNYAQHKTIEDRKYMVNLLIDEFKPTIPILMDNINNDFQNAYNPWPDRAFMFLNGKIKYIAKPDFNGGRNAYWTDEIANLL